MSEGFVGSVVLVFLPMRHSIGDVDIANQGFQPSLTALDNKVFAALTTLSAFPLEVGQYGLDVAWTNCHLAGKV